MIKQEPWGQVKQRGRQRERNEGERGRGETQTQERKHSQSSNKQGRGQRSQNAERADSPAHAQMGSGWAHVRFLSSVVRMCLAAMSSSFRRCAVSAGQFESSCSIPLTICWEYLVTNSCTRERKATQSHWWAAAGKNPSFINFKTKKISSRTAFGSEDPQKATSKH